MSDKTKAVAKQPAPAAAAPREAPDALEQDLLAKARTPTERQEAYALASMARRADMVRRVAAAMAEVGWGKEISPAARAATIRYCFEVGADPVRHVFVLGGNIFINGTYYREAIAEHQGYLYSEEPEWFHEDARLAPDEQERRRQMRVMNNIPDDCPSCCVLRVHFKGEKEDRVVIGIGRVRAGYHEATQNRPKRAKDPVGLEFPREAAETRAWREVGEKVIGPWLRSHAPQLKAAEGIIVQGRELVEAPEVADLPPDPVAERQRLLEAAKQESAPAAEREMRHDPEDAEAKTVRHAPNGICGEDDWHPRSECALEPKP